MINCDAFMARIFIVVGVYSETASGVRLFARDYCAEVDKAATEAYSMTSIKRGPYSLIAEARAASSASTVSTRWAAIPIPVAISVH